MSKHTPGPWEFLQSPDGLWQIVEANGTKSIMGNESYYPWVPRKKADWYLIAAAPELLEALKQARRCLAWACEQRPEFQAEYDAVDAVIAKATGAA